MNSNAYTKARLEQIEHIVRNARTSWLGLLALLVFVGITLMGHKDIDFFAIGVETALPLVGISVPTVTFFIVSPVLTAALYIYLHLYLHGLWIALAKCPSRINTSPLEEFVYPAMICTSALVVRYWMRREADKPIEMSRIGTLAISLLVVWLLGPFVLGLLWWRSMPYHHEWLTLWAGIWFWLTLIVGASSLFGLCHVMRVRKPLSVGRSRYLIPILRSMISAGLLGVFVTVSWNTTEGGRFVPLATASLTGAELTRKPAQWPHYNVWLERWEHQFRLREGLELARSKTSWPEDKLNKFRHETQQRWQALTQLLDSPDLQGADLRRADLRGAFLSGANLTGARLQGANLLVARLEGTNLNNARLDGADLRSARLEGATLNGTVLENADFRGAWLGSANLSSARLRGANLSWTRLQRANFKGSRLKDVDISSARLEGVSFSNADLEDVDLRASILEDTSFRNARMKGVNALMVRGLSQPQLDGACGDEHTTLPAGLTIPRCAE